MNTPPAWTTDLDAAFVEARTSGRKILLEFGAHW
jgi:hypothetical protein